MNIQQENIPVGCIPPAFTDHTCLNRNHKMSHQGVSSKFEQVYSDDHQMSLARGQAWGGPRLDVWGGHRSDVQGLGDFPGLMSKGGQAGGSGLYNEVQMYHGQWSHGDLGPVNRMMDTTENITIPATLLAGG